MHRHRVLFLSVLLVACSTVEPKEHVAVSTSSEGVASGDRTSTSGSSNDGVDSSSEEHDADTDGSPIFDEWDQPPESDGNDSTNGEEANAPEDSPACCFCDADYSWECFAWFDGEASCLEWGYDHGLTATYDPDCPEAWTPELDDDDACLAVCV